MVCSINWKTDRGIRLRSWWIPMLVALFAMPQLALANSGTPLMWITMIHLVAGNLLIGLGEGLVLARYFSVPKVTAIGFMIVANYLSAWFGALVFRAQMVASLAIDLNNGWQWFWGLVVAAYLMTLALEWPFIAWCLRKSPDWWRRSLRASLVVQSVSYLVLFGCYYGTSFTSLYTRADVVLPVELSLPKSLLVYYISPDDGAVYRRPVTGNIAEKICALGSHRKYDRLFVWPNPNNTNCWDILARLPNESDRSPTYVTIVSNLNQHAAPSWQAVRSDFADYTQIWDNFGPVQPIAGATNGPWVFSTGYWAAEGLSAYNEETHKRLRFSIETPFVAWQIRNATRLPEDKVIFQLGDDQICAFDFQNRKVALLWRGRGPVVMREKPEQ